MCIRSDSQSALKAICSKEICNKLVQEVTQLLEDLRQDGQTSLEWVKGHSGDDQANDLADDLAKEGSHQVDTLTRCYKPSAIDRRWVW